MYRSGPVSTGAGLLARLALVGGLLAASSSAYSAPLDRPGGNAPAKPVPPGLLGKIAVATAEHISGLKLTAGKPLPYCNFSGEIIAYEFPLVQSRPAFPDDDMVSAELREAREKAKGREGYKFRKAVWGAGKYWSITLSSTEDRYPVLEVMEGLPRWYTMGEAALGKAREKLGGGNVRLARIFYGSPVEQLFEFTDGSRTVLVDPFALAVYEPGKIKERKGAPNDAQNREIREKWKKFKAMAK